MNLICKCNECNIQIFILYCTFRFKLIHNNPCWCIRIIWEILRVIMILIFKIFILILNLFLNKLLGKLINFISVKIRWNFFQFRLEFRIKFDIQSEISGSASLYIPLPELKRIQFFQIWNLHVIEKSNQGSYESYN